jgi:type IV pilus assembly protein PilC
VVLVLLLHLVIEVKRPEQKQISENMKLDELAFFNQQLASMLKSGLPLEGSLRQLAAGMGKGKFRDEITALEGRLAAGVPLEKAVEESRLPEFYKRMLIAGRASESLPQVLLLLADYYQQAGVLATKVKGAMFYPGIVVVGSWLLSMFVWYLYFTLRDSVMPVFQGLAGMAPSPQFVVGMVLPSAVISLAAVSYLVVTLSPPLRRLMMWRMPGLKDASVSRLAHLFGMMLRSGCPVKETLPVLRQLECGSPADGMIRAWEQMLAGGHVTFESLSLDNSPLPPLFFWLVGSDPEDWPKGLLRAAQLYHHRARNKLDLVLTAITPVSVIVLGMLILYQCYALYSSLLAGFLIYL